MENIFEEARRIISKLIDEKKVSGDEALILTEALICNGGECTWGEKEHVEKASTEVTEEKRPEKIPETFDEWKNYPNGYIVIDDRGVYTDPITGKSYPQHSYKYIQNPYNPIRTYLDGKKITENSHN